LCLLPARRFFFQISPPNFPFFSVFSPFAYISFSLFSPVPPLILGFRARFSSATFFSFISWIFLKEVFPMNVLHSGVEALHPLLNEPPPSDSFSFPSHGRKMILFSLSEVLVSMKRGSPLHPCSFSTICILTRDCPGSFFLHIRPLCLFPSSLGSRSSYFPFVAVS